MTIKAAAIVLNHDLPRGRLQRALDFHMFCGGMANDVADDFLENAVEIERQGRRNDEGGDLGSLRPLHIVARTAQAQLGFLLNVRQKTRQSLIRIVRLGHSLTQTLERKARHVPQFAFAIGVHDGKQTGTHVIVQVAIDLQSLLLGSLTHLQRAAFRKAALDQQAARFHFALQLAIQCLCHAQCAGETHQQGADEDQEQHGDAEVRVEDIALPARAVGEEHQIDIVREKQDLQQNRRADDDRLQAVFAQCDDGNAEHDQRQRHRADQVQRVGSRPEILWWNGKVRDGSSSGPGSHQAFPRGLLDPVHQAADKAVHAEDRQVDRCVNGGQPVFVRNRDVQSHHVQCHATPAQTHAAEPEVDSVPRPDRPQHETDKAQAKTEGQQNLVDLHLPEHAFGPQVLQACTVAEERWRKVAAPATARESHQHFIAAGPPHGLLDIHQQRVIPRKSGAPLASRCAADLHAVHEHAQRHVEAPEIQAVAAGRWRLFKREAKPHIRGIEVVYCGAGSVFPRIVWQRHASPGDIRGRRLRGVPIQEFHMLYDLQYRLLRQCRTLQQEPEQQR